MYPIKQSTALTLPFFVHDASGDAVTGLTDGSFTKRISKGSGAFAAMTVTITEMENGWYSIPLTTTHSNTLGLLTIVFTNASAKQVNLQFRVSANLLDDVDTAVDAIQTDLDNGTDGLGAIKTAVDTKASQASVDDVPTVAEFNARTLLAADYFDPAADTVANVTTVGSVTGAVGSISGITFPTNFADLSISVTTGLVDITQTAADKAWSTGTRVLTAGTNLNDIDAATVNAQCDTAIADASLATAAALATVDANVDSLLTATPQKNAAFADIPFFMVDSTDHVTPETGLTVTVTVSLDGGAFGATTGTVTEIANGLYHFDASAADMNGDIVVFQFAATGADNAFAFFQTRT